MKASTPLKLNGWPSSKARPLGMLLQRPALQAYAAAFAVGDGICSLAPHHDPFDDGLAAITKLFLTHNYAPYKQPEAAL